MENKVINTIKNRTSTRSYSAKKVSLKKLELILEAGKMAPSGMNRQICNILAIHNGRYVNSLVEASKKVRGKDCYYGAKTIILVYGPKDDPFVTQDASCILENMFVAAEALKIASCWINQSEEILSDPRNKKLRAKLGIGEDKVIVGSCILGYSEAPKSIKERKADFIRII